MQALPAYAAPYTLPLLGGLTIGVVTLGRLILSGKVLGISGTLKGVLEGDRSLWRVLFLSGLFTGGLCLQSIYPAAFDPPTVLETLPLPRLMAAGLAVGAGTALSNGCTSGHGICGNARMSPRSLAATLTFMATGALSCSVLNTAGMQGVPPGFIMPPAPAANELALGGAVLTAAAALVAGIAFTASAAKEQLGKRAWLEGVVDLGSGFLFALGLGVAGMTKPTKVASFLSLQDVSLAFVMGGALLVTLPAYQLVMRTQTLSKPLLAIKFSLPTSSAVDWRLLGGSALFGAGWGAAGLCPGPAIVGLATLQFPAAVFVASLAAGMLGAKGLGA